MNNINTVLNIAADSGKIMLENGAETFRVEDTVSSICNCFGIKEVNCFVTPTVIIISINDHSDNPVSVIRRVFSRSMNLEKVTLVNNLSRNICSNSISLEAYTIELETIENSKGYDFITMIMASALVAASITLLFGGNYKDVLVAIVCGLAVKATSIKLNKLKLNVFFTTASASAIAAIISLIAVYLNFADHSDIIIIGANMLLVPGLAITNAIRDTIAGDLVSGVSITAEAFLTAIAVATGTGLILKFWTILFGGGLL